MWVSYIVKRLIVDNTIRCRSQYVTSGDLPRCHSSGSWHIVRFAMPASLICVCISVAMTVSNYKILLYFRNHPGATRQGKISLKPNEVMIQGTVKCQNNVIVNYLHTVEGSYLCMHDPQHGVTLYSVCPGLPAAGTRPGHVTHALRYSAAASMHAACEKAQWRNWHDPRPRACCQRGLLRTCWWSWRKWRPISTAYCCLELKPTWISTDVIFLPMVNTQDVLF